MNWRQLGGCAEWATRWVVVVVGAAGWSVAGGAAEFPTFTVHRIDQFGMAMGQTALVDVDRDGDLDWIAGNANHAKERPGAIFWWEYRGPDDWVRRELGKGRTDVGGAAHDVDGDGWVDFVAGLVLLLNSGEPRTKAFVAHEVGALFSHDTEFADVNSDGRMDVIANHETGGLAWFEIPRVVTQPWTKHVIAEARVPKIHGGVSPKAVADIDGDGDVDVYAGAGPLSASKKFASYIWENTGKGRGWIEHVLQVGRQCHEAEAADVDGDGDIDLCTKPWKDGNEHLFFRNMLKENAAKVSGAGAEAKRGRRAADGTKGLDRAEGGKRK